MNPLPLHAPLNIVLVAPRIPGNTGNIARTCAVTGSRLHLVNPLFRLEDRDLKRAGLDYWDKVHGSTCATFDDLLKTQLITSGQLHLFTARAPRTMYDVCYTPGDYLIFGQEDLGLDESLLARFPERQVAVPMVDGVRSLNLSTCAGIALYEALRQLAFSR